MDNGEVLLEDDKGMFPPYNSTLVMKQETAEKAGADLPKVLDQIQSPGRVIQTSLDDETEERLQHALAAAGRPA